MSWRCCKKIAFGHLTGSFKRGQQKQPFHAGPHELPETKNEVRHGETPFFLLLCTVLIRTTTQTAVWDCPTVQINKVELFFSHEYGRRVGMMPRSSLKEGKNNQMVEKRTRTTKTTQNKTKHSPQAESPPSCSLSSVLGETSETQTNG